MSGSFHSADVEPAGDKSSHHLLVNGEIVARFNSLQTALQARAELINQSINSRNS